MPIKLFTLLMLGALLSAPISVSAEDNPELQRLFDADQNARRDPNMSWDEIDTLDEANRAEVLAMLARGEIKTGLDYFQAAVIMQHGESAEDIRLAHSFATLSSQLGYDRATWMQAASWDRLLMYFEQPQWYGTQFTIDDDGQWHLYEVQEGAVSDEQRAEWRVPSLSESKERARQRNEG
ncbi:hypothetical protein [Aliidiomarina maris]|uniref:Uncharacterized protein n=1 Tax=Aliidiomarina maris TaxID=531312 RepID=A0A327WP45_9GAMM|nr:hypothetical protein [Aliidiomarina maris]RAJ93304.1 hypothetical protein B0I24_12031 [Aliidiomarina maris]RUO18558.1 hypothetical protein CWE07_13755 [Aliidiomarina maris]